MREALRATASGLVLFGIAFAALTAFPVTRTWGTATSVSGSPVVSSAADAVGVLSLRILVAVALAAAILYAGSFWRRSR